MRHVVIKLHLVVHDSGQSDSEVAADYTIEGWNLLARLSGQDKHVEVEVHDLEKTEVSGTSYSQAHKRDLGEVPPITAEQLARGRDEAEDKRHDARGPGLDGDPSDWEA